jgi:protein gp37
MQKTNIEYLTHTWNPIAMRCDPVSEGCANCWHIRMAKRLASNPVIDEFYRDSYTGGTPSIRTGELDAPFKLRKPAVIGVEFMGDLFHDEVPLKWIAAVYGIIAANQRHQFVVITKRLDRCEEFYDWLDDLAPGMRWWKVHLLIRKANEIFRKQDWPSIEGCTWPLQNLILSTSVENQRLADERIQKLLQIPAWKRMVSYEPALGPVDFKKWLVGNPLDLISAGAETGPGARPCDSDWLRSARDQCAEAGVPFFLKQVDAKGTREIDERRHEEFV